MLNKIIKALRNPKAALFYILGFRLFKIIPDTLYLKIKYKIIFGKKLDLKNPRTFNEKIQWIKLYDHNPLYTQITDKYEVRKYIEKFLGSNYLIPLIGVYNSVDEINWDTLPEQFVLKCTHGSGYNIICKNKSDGSL